MFFTLKIWTVKFLNLCSLTVNLMNHFLSRYPFIPVWVKRSTYTSSSFPHLVSLQFLIHNWNVLLAPLESWHAKSPFFGEYPQSCNMPQIWQKYPCNYFGAIWERHLGGSESLERIFVGCKSSDIFHLCENPLVVAVDICKSRSLPKVIRTTLNKHHHGFSLKIIFVLYFCWWQLFLVRIFSGEWKIWYC